MLYETAVTLKINVVAPDKEGAEALAMARLQAALRMLAWEAWDGPYTEPASVEREWAYAS